MVAAMKIRAPVARRPQSLVLERGWLFPTAVMALLLAGAFLPFHRVGDPLEVATATIAALGLIGASVAAPRWVRGMVAGSVGRIALLGSEPFPEVEEAPPAGRRIVAVALSAAVSMAGTAASAVLLTTFDPSTAGHAVLIVALYANVALLLTHVTPIPPWAGWTLLLAFLDRRPARAENRIDRAVPIAQLLIAAEAAAIVAIGVAASDWMLLVLPTFLIWQGWRQTAIAQADDVISRCLAARRLGAVARRLTTTAVPDEPALLAAARRPSSGALIAVMAGGALYGVVGPQQVAAVVPTAPRTPCREVMIPVGDLQLLRADAPAASALPQLHRYGFAVVVDSGHLGYVKVDDLLQRILMTAAVSQAVRDRSRAE